MSKKEIESNTNEPEEETKMGEALRQLKCACLLIRKPETWCQGKDRFRESYSLLGILSNVGVDRSFGHNRNDDGDYPNSLKRDEMPEAIWFLRNALNNIAPEFCGSIGKWNDAPGRKHHEVFNLLGDAIKLIEYETSKDSDGDEVPDTCSAMHQNNTPQDNLNALHVSGPQCGMFNLPVHYTLGRGLAEELGEDLLDIAVFTAFREATKAGNTSDLNHHEFDFKGLYDAERIGIAVESWWDKRARCICMHLELTCTDNMIFLGEGEELEGPNPHDRLLN